MVLKNTKSELVLSLLILLVFLQEAENMTSHMVVDSLNPVFAEPIPNKTVIAGRNASLPCVIDNLQGYRVAWIHTQGNTLLSLQNRVITRSSRYKVSNNSQRTWYLHITNVQERDRGEYMCQINTDPMMAQKGFLEVLVPPYLNEELTSDDTEVREGGDVSLKCYAKGAPVPDVTWRREDGQEISLGKSKATSVPGNTLNITKVSRLHMGAYICIASNNVQPAMSKRIMLEVNFTPMIWIPNQLVGAPVGTDVLLQCNLESQPQSITYWMKEGGIMVLTNNKYRIEMKHIILYKVQLMLHINNLQPEDFGSYTCVAKNSLGETEGTIRLYEIPPPSSVINAQASDVVYQSKSEKLRNGHQQNSYKNNEEKDGSRSASESNRLTISYLSSLMYIGLLVFHHIFVFYIS